jgi:ADP-ribosylglycohydrolase
MLCDRYRGALLGLAVGDALGTTLEFKAPGTFKPITDMIGGGPFGLKPVSGLTIPQWHYVSPKA